MLQGGRKSKLAFLDINRALLFGMDLSIKYVLEEADFSILQQWRQEMLLLK